MISLVWFSSFHVTFLGGVLSQSGLARIDVHLESIGVTFSLGSSMFGVFLFLFQTDLAFQVFVGIYTISGSALISLVSGKGSSFWFTSAYLKKSKFKNESLSRLFFMSSFVNINPCSAALSDPILFKGWITSW